MLFSIFFCNYTFPSKNVFLQRQLHTRLLKKNFPRLKSLTKTLFIDVVFHFFFNYVFPSNLFQAFKGNYILLKIGFPQLKVLT